MSLRLISADDHVDLSHDNIKAFLDPSFHSFYDDAVGSFGGSMRNMLTNTSNSRWREQRGLAEDDGSAQAMANLNALCQTHLPKRAVDTDR